MLAHQFLLGLWFYLVFSLCAGCGLFLTHKLFARTTTAYFLAKPLGLAAFGYLVWVLSFLKLLNYQNSVFIVALFLIFTALGFAYTVKLIYVPLSSQKRKALIKSLLLLELISLILYMGYLYLRSFNAAAFGTERFMDMAFLNASLKAQHFPFTDPWYAGKAVNYYYYGHYLVSLLTKLSGSTSFLTYNFALGLLYAVSFMLAGFLVYEITSSKWFAVLSGFLVTTAGSLFYSGCALNTWFKVQPICSYASSTRLYTPSYIINEIPSYSFTVGDMHAHFLALPFFIVNLILIYCLSEQEKPSKTLALALLVSLVTSTLINPSDAVTLVLLLGLVWVFKIYRLNKKNNSLTSLFKSADIKPWLYLAIFLGAGTLILYLPFLLNFTSPVLGFGLAWEFASKHHFLFNGFQYPTPLLAEMGMWGFFGTSLILAFYFLRKELNELTFTVLSSLAALILIVFVEVYFVKDIYHITNPPYFRANTVFKFGYHTWVLLSVAFSVAVAAVFSKLSLQGRRKNTSRALAWVLAIFIFLSSIYPVQAIQQYYLTNVGPKTLDAAAFMPSQSADDLAAVNYINQNIKNRSVVLEAVGDSYTYFARMSVFTGMIAPMGWKTHEWTWRFDGAKAAKIMETDPKANVETGYGPIYKVGEDVKNIYETTNISQTVQLLKQYGVEYVYIGDLERSTYPNLQEQKFTELGTLIFQSGNSKLFKIN